MLKASWFGAVAGLIGITATIIARFHQDNPTVFWLLLLLVALSETIVCIELTKMVARARDFVFKKENLTFQGETSFMKMLTRSSNTQKIISSILSMIGWIIVISFSQSVLLLIPFFFFSTILSSRADRLNRYIVRLSYLDALIAQKQTEDLS